MHAPALRQLGIEGKQWRTGIIRRPPRSRHQLGPVRWLRGVRESAIAPQRPCSLWRGVDLLGRHTVHRDDPRPQARHLTQAAYPGLPVEDGIEAGKLI